ncbi:MAG: peptidyl-prolyl cis-trans isomerase [Puniceicoccales bacterium]|jgi:parvulin-like peptidyl-prolyl isomerase|nr:peptidyl-prolyl cis-trans isomerase [Puniceicoccales bacterium]
MAIMSRLLFILTVASPAVSLFGGDIAAASAGSVGGGIGGNFWRPDYVNGIVAVANGRPITAGELRQELYAAMGRLEMEAGSQGEFDELVHRTANEILSHMVDRILIVQEFERGGAKIPEQQKNFYFDEFIRNRFGGDRLSFVSKLREYGKTVGQFKREMEEGFIVDMMEGRIRRSRTEISPLQLRSYYETHGDEFTVPAAIRIGQIFLRDGEGDAAAIMGELAEGESFNVLRDRHSPETAAMEDDWIPVRDMRPEFAAAERLPVGANFGPIAVDNGTIIATLIERREGKTLPLEEVQDEIEGSLLRERIGKARECWLNGLRKDAYVKMYL